MEKEKRLELLEKTLSRLMQWIAVSDARIPFVFAIDTSMLAVFAALVPNTCNWTVKSSILAISAVVLLLLSLFFLFLAAFPRTKGPEKSIIHFECIKEMKFDAYLNELKEISEDDYIGDLADQCHRNAKIASAKFRFIRYSMLSLFAGVFPWLLVMFALYKERG